MSATEKALHPISMTDAVGYAAIDCEYQTLTAEALVLKHDRFFLLLDERGNIAPPGQCGLGLFHDDTRILGEYVLTFAGNEFVLLSSQVTSPFHLYVDLAITDEMLGGDHWDPKNAIHIRRELLLTDRLIERTTLTNHLTRPLQFAMSLALGSDFADIFEVRGWKRSRRGQFYATEVGERSLGFFYRGLDGLLLESDVTFLEPPTRLGARGVEWEISLAAGERRELRWEIAPGPGEAPMEEESDGVAMEGRAIERQHIRLAETYARWRSECAQWHTDIAEFNTTLRQAVDDLRSLYIRDAREEIICAGIPWYCTPFGRDSIITALQTLALNPRIAIDTLRYLARHQGEKEDAFTEEQPGRIMHELRRGELARNAEIPHIPYYGSVDATPLWIVLLHETWRWTGDDDLARDLLPHAERALEWIDRYGDLDGDGFVEYSRTSSKGLVNQGWKDSGDGIPWPDGALPEPPIALVEVQGYVHDAKARMAQLMDAFGRPDRATTLRSEADQLAERIRERFWMEETGTFALALDRSKNPIPTITTNAGHLLWSRVPTPEQARRMAEVFAAPDMFCGWGIRTLSAAHRVFNPMSYHNGSVWPHDNALVVLGLSHYGLVDTALPVLAALHDVAMHTESQRLPELFCGIERAGGTRPVLYPVSCSPQAWASGALFMLLQAVLGLLPDASQGILHIRRPRLPLFMEEVTINNLRVGNGSVGLQFRRRGKQTFVNLLSQEGDPPRVQIEL